MKKRMSVAEAKEVLAEHRLAEQEKQNQARRARYLGRFFRFDNSQGNETRWWVYATVTDVGPYGHLTGLSFQHSPSGGISVEYGRSLMSMTEGYGWREIDADEFWREAAALSAAVAAKLARTETP